jgi:hypothetical protein
VPGADIENRLHRRGRKDSPTETGVEHDARGVNCMTEGWANSRFGQLHRATRDGVRVRRLAKRAGAVYPLANRVDKQRARKTRKRPIHGRMLQDAGDGWQATGVG